MGGGKGPISRDQGRSGKAEREWGVSCDTDGPGYGDRWGQFFPMDGLLSPLPASGTPVAYLLHGCPELALEVVHVHLDAHSCREQEGGGQGQMNVWEGRR